MATKQDPPKKTMKDLLKKISKSGDRASASQSYQSMARGAVSSMLPKTNALKSALAKGDKSSASSSFTARAAKKVATGAGKALKSMAANKIVSKMDSLPKQTYFSNKPTLSLIERMGKKSLIKKAKPDTVKIDSVKKVTPIGGSKPSVIIKKQTTVKPAKPGVISGPYRPNPESKNKPQVKTLPYKIEYKKDKFGKNQVVKPSNPVMKLKGK
jgi:hypothetical protein